MKNTILSICAILTALLLFGCNADGVGIFYTISQEKELSGSDLSGLFIRSFVTAGTKVYAGAGASVWKQSSGGWDNISMKGMDADPAIASDGSAIYAALYSEDDSSREKELYSYDGSSWSKVSGAPGKAISYMIIEGGDHDYIVRSSDNTSYTVHETGDFNNPVTFDTENSIALPVVDAAFDGTNVVLVAGNSSSTKVYYSTTNERTFVSSSVGYASDQGIGGIVSKSLALGANFYLSQKDGKVYSSTDGNNWSSEDTAPDNYSDDTPELFDMAQVNYNGSDLLLIGSDQGYYEMDLSGSSITRPDVSIDASIDIPSSYPTLADGLVRNFYVDGSNTFLMGTETGVWENLNGRLDQK